MLTSMEKALLISNFSDNRYMKYTIHTLTITTFFLAAPLFAGPEKHDPMGQFKLSKVEEQGPSREVVLDKEGNQVAEAKYIYNEKGQLVESQFISAGNPDGKNEFIYNEKGLASEKLYNKQNKVVEELVYTLDKSGQVTAFVVLDEKGKEIIEWKFEYKEGKLVSGKRFIEKEVTEYFTQEAVSENEIIQHIFADDNETVGFIKITLNDDLVVSRFKNDLTGKYEIKYKYSESGKLMTMEFYSLKEKSNLESELVLEKSHRFFYEEIAGKSINAQKATIQPLTYDTHLK